MKVATVNEMRNLDRIAVERYGIREELLMENAGQAACSVLLREIGISGKRFCIFCGIGNNGGDGFVIARKIHSNGGIVKVLVAGDPAGFKGAAKLNLDILSRLPVETVCLDTSEQAKTDIAHCDVIVDALFGTGLSREVEGLHREIIGCINQSGKIVFSVDIPSGVNGDTGKIMGVAVRAAYTATFGLPKIGMMLYPAYDLCGKIYVSHISFPPELYDNVTLKLSISGPPALPDRNPDGHKGFFGEALFVAGASGYFGAPHFAALSFLKAGGGYSRLAAPRSIIPFIAVQGSESVFLPQPETTSGSIAYAAVDSLLELSEKMDMVVIGPGLSLAEETGRLVRTLTAKIQKPLIIDGDGITAVSGSMDVVRAREFPTVLTPHLGEMARMTGTPVKDIDKGKVAVLQKAAKDLGAVIVLKGAHSLIGYPDERVLINLSGNSGMATAGSGDVLTGTIAAMACLGLTFEEAVAKGVFIHGLAGDLAAEKIGEDGMTAQDILDFLPEALRFDRSGLNETLKARYRGIYVI